VGNSATTTATKGLLKFRKKVLDILTNWEHYVPTQPTKFFRIGLLRTTPRHPFSRRGIKQLVV
jgi:hypothetical protein